MKITLIKNFTIGLCLTIFGIYLLFLIIPFLVSPVIKNYIPQVNEEIKKATGLNSSIDGLKLVTTPALGIGAKFDKFIITTPENSEVINAGNFEISMSLPTLLTKKIKIDKIKLNDLNLNLALNKDGSFVIEKYFPAQEEEKEESKSTEPTEKIELPFGLRLSNHLPDIIIGGYNINFIDISNKNTYIFKGNKTEITDFIFNKNIKILADGNITLAGREQFKFNLKINNKIMPETDLNELVFGTTDEKDKKKDDQNIEINLLDIFKGIYNNKITANFNSDLTLTKESNKGFLDIENLSVSPSGLSLPPSNIKLNFNGQKIDINSNIYTAQNENSTITGTVQTGNKTDIDIVFKSDAELSNLVKIVNAVAQTFNIKDLQTLTANGKIDANFNIKSNLKNIDSDGYLKIPNARVHYGLYNITVDKINTDIALNDNNINIKNLSFTIFNQPLKLFGTVKQDATADLHLTGDNLSLKGLIIAFGQSALLKENKINSGLVSLKVDIIGKLDSIKPTAKVNLNNIDIKNIPVNTTVKIPATDINIITDGQAISGSASGTNIMAINPAATVSIPKLSANIKEDCIEVLQTPVNVEKINFNTQGKINNYLSEKISLDFSTTGDIISKLTGDMNIAKQTLNLNYATTQNSKIIVPMFDKSKLVFNTNLGITGSMLNPQVSGTVNVPSLDMPEIPVTMENIHAKLHGDMINGSGTAAKFTSGGIVADTLSADFSMKGENLYLNNLKGNAFDGKFSGNIIYNMANAKTSIDFKGNNMDAEKAIAGAAGIKNALTGTLEFNTKLKLIVYPDFNDMMRSMIGDLDFKINNGAFGKIGRLENFLRANNIIGNTVLKTTVNSFSNIAAIKNTAEFDYISGNMNFSNGWANITNIKSTGKSLAYFITGKYSLINGTTNVTILGRLDGSIVKLLGPLGELSAEKILSRIPIFGELTARYASSLTTNPDNERIKDIPELSTGTKICKDFKVEFNGGIESTTSVKSFKWLSKVDTSAIEQPSIKETVKSFKTNVSTDINTTVNTVKDKVNTVKAQGNQIKETAKEQKEQLKESVNELKNLFKLKPSSTTTEASTSSAAEQNQETTTPAVSE